VLDNMQTREVGMLAGVPNGSLSYGWESVYPLSGWLVTRCVGMELRANEYTRFD
jgi:hypothetical protein